MKPKLLSLGMKQLTALLLLLLLAVCAPAQTHVQFILSQGNLNISPFTNVAVTLQQVGINTSSTMTFLGEPICQYTDTNAQTTFSNLQTSAGGATSYWQWNVPANSTPNGPANSYSGYIQVTSTNLGLINSSLVQVFNVPTPTGLGWAYSAQTSDLRYSPTAVVLTNYALNGNLITASNQLYAQIVGATNGMTSIVYSNPATAFTTPTQVTNLINALAQTSSIPSLATITNIAVTAASNQGANDTNYTTGATNVAVANLTAGLVATNATIQAELQASNTIYAANLNTASNYLAGHLQGGSITLSNLAVTGAVTNQYVAGANVTITTNGSGTIQTINATNQTFLLASYGTTNQNNVWYDTNGAAIAAVTNATAGMSNNVLGTVTNYVTHYADTNGAATNAAIAAVNAATNSVLGTVTNYVTGYADTNGAGAYFAKTATNGMVTTNVLNQFYDTNGAARAAIASLAYQPTSSVLTLLSGTGANTNQYVFSGNVLTTTNAGGSIITVNVTNQTSLLNGYANTNQNNIWYDTNGAGAVAVAYAQTATNFMATNYIPYVLTNSLKFEDAAGDYMSNGVFVSSVGDKFGHSSIYLAGGAFQVLSGIGQVVANGYQDSYGAFPPSTNIALATSLYSATNGLLASTNGSASNLSIADDLLFGIDTNMQVSTSCIGVWGGGSGNGGYYQLTSSVWTNYPNPGYAIIYSGGNYYLQSNNVTIYFNSTAQGNWQAAGGLLPAPHSAYTFKFHCNGVQFDGYLYSTNITAQIASAINTLTNLSGGGGTNIVIVGGYGISNSISATGNTNTIFINTNVTATVAWVLSVITAPTNGISAITASNIVANYGSILYYPLTTNPSNYVTQIALNGSNYTTLNFVTNLVTVTSNALIQLAGVTPTTVTNIVANNAPGIAQSTLVGGIMVGSVTNMSLNTAGTNTIINIANTLAQIQATNAIGNLNGAGTNTTLSGTTYLINSNMSVLAIQGPISLPLMTSSNSPSGLAYYDSEGSTFGFNNPAYFAFTNGTVQASNMAPALTNQFIYYQLQSPQFITNMSGIFGAGLVSGTNTFLIQYSSDGTNWSTEWSNSLPASLSNGINIAFIWSQSNLPPFAASFVRWGVNNTVANQSAVFGNLNLFYVGSQTNYINSSWNLTIQATNTITLQASNVVINGQQQLNDGVPTIAGLYASQNPIYTVTSFNNVVNSFNGNYGLWTYPLPITGTNIYLNANAEKFAMQGSNWMINAQIPAIILTNQYYVFFNFTRNRYYTNGSLYGYYQPYGNTTPTNWLYLTNATGLYNLTNAYGTLPTASLPSSVVTNGYTFYPEQFGAKGDGVTDDTLPIQAAITNAQAFNGVVQLDSRTYKLTTNLWVNLTNGSLTILGKGVKPIYPTAATNSQEALNAPSQWPFLTGSVLLQAGTNQSIIIVTNGGRSFNASDFGLLWTTNTMFTKAGHGIFCQPNYLGASGFSQMGINNGYDDGIMHSTWQNLFCIGSGTNCCSYHIGNGLYNDFIHIQSVFSGIGFEYEAMYNQYPGNFTLLESDFFPVFGAVVGIHINNSFAGWHVANFSIIRSQVGNYNLPVFDAIAGGSATSLTNLFLFEGNSANNALVQQCAAEDNQSHQSYSEFHLDSNTGIAIVNSSGFDWSQFNSETNGSSVYSETNMSHIMADTGHSWPTLSQAGFTLGKYPQNGAGYWLYDWSDNQSGGPYFAEMDYDASNARIRFGKRSQAVNGNYGYAFGTWDSKRTTFTTGLSIDEGGNLYSLGGYVKGQLATNSPIAGQVLTASDTTGTNLMWSGPNFNSIAFSGASQNVTVQTAGNNGHISMPNGIDNTGTSLGSVYYGMPFPPGTYSNLILNWYYPGLPAANTNMAFNVTCQGVKLLTDSTLLGSMVTAGNQDFMTNSGTQTFTLTTNAVLAFYIYTTGANNVPGCYYTWSMEKVK